jgi:hypothetical protein
MTPRRLRSTHSFADIMGACVKATVLKLQDMHTLAKFVLLRK